MWNKEMEFMSYFLVSDSPKRLIPLKNLPLIYFLSPRPQLDTNINELFSKQNLSTEQIIWEQMTVMDN